MLKVIIEDIWLIEIFEHDVYFVRKDSRSLHSKLLMQNHNGQGCIETDRITEGMQQVCCIP